MAERIKNTLHPKSPTQKKIRRQEEAQVRQERWDHMTNAEKLQQKLEQGNGDTMEAEALRLRIEEELK